MKPFETFGKYILLERLAAGGMAEVFLAKSTGAGGISKFVAIKRILPQYSDNPEFIDMFKEEARIAMNLNHGNVVSIYEFGVESRQFFLVMEYVEGQNLRQILNHIKKDNKEFNIEQCLYIIKQVAAGLDHAHRCIDSTTGRPFNITHRDMSPQNIMISFEGEVKVVDFGIAKAESQLETTRAGTIKGKFGYMSPEQAEGQNVDSRTDIFSLGIVMWELLAKDRLFTANSEAATLRKIRDCQVPGLRRINPAISPELERIVNKALAKDKSLRYQSAAALHRDLNRFLNTQYPDFSPQDFAIFMKSAFSAMYIENRKKQVEFAKAQAFPAEDRSEVTQTDSAVTVHPDHNPTYDAPKAVSAEEFLQVPQIPFEADSNSHSTVDLKQLKTKSRAVSTFSRGETEVRVGAGSLAPLANAPIGTNPSYRKSSAPKNLPTAEKSNSFMGYFLSVLCVVALASGGLYYGISKNLISKNFVPKDIYSMVSSDSNTSPVADNNPVVEAPANPIPTMGSKDLASVQKPKMVTATLESYPSGARIYIDGVDTGTITPVRREVPANKEFRLGLVKEGFTYFEKIEKVSADGTSLKGNLQALPPMGYVSINVINGGTDPVVYINGQRIDQKPPIRFYGVPADTPIKIRVMNPFTQLAAEKTIHVKASEKRELNMVLNREATGQ